LRAIIYTRQDMTMYIDHEQHSLSKRLLFFYDNIHLNTVENISKGVDFVEK
jgi:hypothetical protein